MQFNASPETRAAVPADDLAAIARHAQWLAAEPGARSLVAMLPTMRVEVEVSRDGSWKFAPRTPDQIRAVADLMMRTGEIRILREVGAR
jgi:hypothetical protein